MKKTLFLCVILFMHYITVTMQQLNAAIIVLPSDDPSETECFSKDVYDALETIRKTDPAFEVMLNTLIGSKFPHTIKQHEKYIHSWGDDDDHTQEILYNPRLNVRFDDGVCLDPIAGLLHELYHAWENERGDLQKNRAIITEDTNYIKLSELNAVKAENVYRRRHGLCPRVTYDGRPLPKKDIIGACQDPKSVVCPPPKSACPRCCCWIAGLVKDTSGAGGCIKDNTTPKACGSYSQPGKVSPACYPSPCNFPRTPLCP
jgi:hypothetical protein